ncbi:uncharacterized protein LOC136076757 [Hydra vulgaris]|uniref:Uncharacterized protein LOC136076757 n=1 Tax=Hydra vulgaris TaxID=6087 RepID=A0ABM4BBG9_HYDVU
MANSEATQENLNLVNLDNLDEDLLDKIFEVDINKAFEKVISSEEISCITCGQICKSKGGLKRHINSAHPLLINAPKEEKLDHLTTIMFSGIVKEVQNTLSYDTCYPEKMRQAIEDYNFEFNDNLYNEVTKLTAEFRSSGNAEIFLSKFYSSIVLSAHNYILNLDKRLGALLVLHIGNHILSFCKKQQNTAHEENITKPISAQELDGLQYLAGYVVHKFIKKTKNNKYYNSKINQDTMEILKKFTTDAFIDQKLICTQNRGGLTVVTKECQNIFILTEGLFRRETSQNNLKYHYSTSIRRNDNLISTLSLRRNVCWLSTEFKQRIDVAKMVSSLMEDRKIISLYSNIVETFENKNSVSYSDLANNILENMLNLYLRIRSFSLTKDIVQLHKEKKKVKSLRKTIKKASQKLCLQE